MTPTPTPVAHPWRATVRTVFQVLIGLAAIAPSLVTAAGLDPVALPLLGTALAVAAVVTRLMASPTVQGFLSIWARRFAADPTRRWRSTLRTVLQAAIALAVIAPVLVTEAGLDPAALPWLAGVLAVAAAVTKFMANPVVEAFLHRWVPWLAAAPAPGDAEYASDPDDDAPAGYEAWSDFDDHRALVREVGPQPPEVEAYLANAVAAEADYLASHPADDTDPTEYPDGRTW